MNNPSEILGDDDDLPRRSDDPGRGGHFKDPVGRVAEVNQKQESRMRNFYLKQAQALDLKVEETMTLTDISRIVDECELEIAATVPVGTVLLQRWSGHRFVVISEATKGSDGIRTVCIMDETTKQERNIGFSRIKNRSFSFAESPPIDVSSLSRTKDALIKELTRKLRQRLKDTVIDYPVIDRHAQRLSTKIINASKTSTPPNIDDLIEEVARKLEKGD